MSAPVFSYAQAAKGLASAASTQSTPRNESPAASEKSAKDRSVSETNNTSSALKSPRLRSELGERVASESTTSKPTTPAEVIVSPESGTNESTGQSQLVLATENDSASGSHTDAVSNKGLERDEAGQRLLNGRKPSSDGSTGPAAQDHDAPIVSDKKSKDGEDDWEKISVPSIPAESQYKAAPPPPVNVWQVRKEAQAAKIKDQQKPIVFGTSNQPKKTRSASEDLKRKPTGREQGIMERETKTADSTITGTRKDMPPARSSRPTSHHEGKTDAEKPPLVIDSQSWPTPENTPVDDRRKSTSYDRVDKADNMSAPQKTHGNKWVSIPFVPTPVFKTPLPPAAAARRGGARGSTRGGRESGGRGGNYASTSAEKADTATSMGPPPLPRQSGEQDRGRQSEDQKGIRGASVPISARPPSSDNPSGASHKANAANSLGRPPADSFANVSAVKHNIEDQVTRTEHSSRSSSRHTANGPGRRVNGDRNASSEQASGGFPQTKEPTLRYSTDRSKAPPSGSLRNNGENGRERGSVKGRDWSKDKPESAREKVESWRDRESSGDQGTRRGGRSERGRAGYRGRGDHSSYNSAYNASHAYTSPLPQNGFDLPAGSISGTESRSRQTSQPFVPTPATSTPRTNPRSQSIPVGMMYPGYFNNGMPAAPQQGLQALQTDMSMYSYPSQMQMQPSIMSAMPYNDPLNSYALLSMVMTQM